MPCIFLIPFVKNTAETIDRSFAKKVSQRLGCEFKVVILGEDYLRMFKDPVYGYGKGLNPCIDCKILMLKKAKTMMKKLGASFIATGEVLGQRPMSQHRKALKDIAKASGLEGFLVRPLSALLLEETEPQKQGWLKKALLFSMHGRDRKPQIGLAKEWGIKDYPWPAGGCLLTDQEFCRRLKDIIKHKVLTVNNIESLKSGRYFRITPDFYLVVGRNEKENIELENMVQARDIIFEPLDLPGPTGLGRGRPNQKIKLICSQIVARYTAKDKKIKVKIRFDSKEEVIEAETVSQKELDRLRV